MVGVLLTANGWVVPECLTNGNYKVRSSTLFKIRRTGGFTVSASSVNITMMPLFMSKIVLLLPVFPDGSYEIHFVESAFASVN
jgi:hypothetical protein